MKNNIQLMRNFHFMVECDPDFLKTKPRLMAAVQYNRTQKITMIFKIIENDYN